MALQKLKTTVLILTILLVSQVQAQESTVASGGDVDGAGGSASYSVGQVFYTTNSGAGGSVAQGIQQAYVVSVLSNPSLTTLNLRVQTYPNPTTDQIVLSVEDLALQDLSYALYDLNGRVLASNRIRQSAIPISLQHLPSGVYLLKVNQNNTELKNFKIIKN